MNCIFCKISKKEIPAFIIDESDNFIAFLDIHPHAPGHSVVIPKNHYENFFDLSEALGNEFISFVKQCVNLLSKKLQTNSFTFGVNQGEIAGQTIKHFHFHIIPRFPNDKGGSIHSVVYNPPQESVEEIFNLIKK
ncbi:MAG: histidine triad protein [Candidatus Parcubacteria bacterium]|nr:MAG: histidine triad protein [Candidatus Parcubacteria bacterium]